MEWDSLLNDDRSYGTSSTVSVSHSDTPLTFPMVSSTTSLNSLMLDPHPLLLPMNQRSESFGSFSSFTRNKDNSDHNDSQDVDENRVHRAIQDAGINAFGIVAVDVWLLDHGRFVHAKGGLWVNPIFCKRHPSDALERIRDPNHPEYAPPLPQVPGAGLAGYFWALGVECLVWRDLHAITSDPFQPPYKRMGVLEEAGFGKATGIPFDILGHRGVVIYLARESASERMLNEDINVNYLRVAAQHIGTASALSIPRQASVQAKDMRATKTYRSVVAKMHCINAFTSLHKSLSTRNLEGLTDMPIRKGKRSVRKVDSFHGMVGIQCETVRQGLSGWTKSVGPVLKQRIASLVEKSQGSSLKPPPPAPLSNAVWTFCGVFLTLLLLFGLSVLAKYETGDCVVLAPFGALLTLQFSLTAAPASQPRNVIYGQVICISMALLAKHYLMELGGWPLWIVVPLTTAGGIAVMTKVGVTHPPAAAAIVALFSKPDNLTILTGALLLVGNLVAVVMAILVNNLSEKRQYPVYWEFGILSTVESLSEQLRQTLPRWKPTEKPLDFQEYVAIQEGPRGPSFHHGSDSDFNDEDGPMIYV